MKKYVVTLTREERDTLEALTSKGKHAAQEVLNALILLGCDAGEFQKSRSKNEDLSRVLNISMRKIDRVKERFVTEGLEVALTGRERTRIYPKKADGDFEAHLIALSCSEPPEGFSRWTLRLLADKVVELEYIDTISHETIRQILKKRTKTLEATRMDNPPPIKAVVLLRIWSGSWTCTSAHLIRSIPSYVWTSRQNNSSPKPEKPFLPHPGNLLATTMSTAVRPVQHFPCQ